MNAQTIEKTSALPLSSEPLTPEGILQLGLGFWASKTLLSAVELGVFTELGRGPLSADELIARIGLHRRSAHDFLDALVALGMLERGSGRYANAPAADLFLDRNKQAYVGGMLEMANARLYPFWANLTDALKTGQPQNEVKHGGDFFAGLYSAPDRLAGFLKAMTGISVGSATAIAKVFPWAQYRTFADIGAAQGGMASQVALAHPHLRGVGFDPLPSADVLVMGHVLHDWALDQKKILIEKAYAALPAGGVLIVYETIIDDDRRRNVFGLLMSLNMLIETPGGADYTAAECKQWMQQIGFKTTKSEHLVGPESMVIGIK